MFDSLSIMLAVFIGIVSVHAITHLLDTRICLTRAQGKRPRLLYTIPTGQNPSGTTLSDERRVELYALACQHDLIILEDDPYVFGKRRERSLHFTRCVHF